MLYPQEKHFGLVPLKSIRSAESAVLKHEILDIIDNHNCQNIYARKLNCRDSGWKARAFYASRVHSSGYDNFNFLSEYSGMVLQVVERMLIVPQVLVHASLYKFLFSVKRLPLNKALIFSAAPAPTVWKVCGSL